MAINRKNLPVDDIRSGGQIPELHNQVCSILWVHPGRAIFNLTANGVHHLDRIKFIFQSLIEPEPHMDLGRRHHLERLGFAADQLGMSYRLWGGKAGAKEEESAEGTGHLAHER